MRKLGLVLPEKITKAFITVIMLCCIYGIFSGLRVLLNESEVIPGGKHTRNLITASDYVNIFMVVRRVSIGGAIAAIHSIIRNTNSPIHFNLVTDSETSNYLWLWIEHSKLKDISYEIKGVSKEWLERRIGISGNITYLLPYSSVVLGDLFPYLKGNVVVLEDDVIVQGNIVELKNLKFNKNFVASFASNCGSIRRRFKFTQKIYASFVDVRKSHFRDLHLNASACTFASGVYVLDVNVWKEKNITSQILQLIHLNQKGDLYKGDSISNAMMIALFGQIQTLDPLWNIMDLGISPSSRYDIKFLQKAKLLHWSGPFKPWKRRSPYHFLWDKYFLPDPTGEFKPVRKMKNNTER